MSTRPQEKQEASLSIIKLYIDITLHPFRLDFLLDSSDKEWAPTNSAIINTNMSVVTSLPPGLTEAELGLILTGFIVTGGQRVTERGAFENTQQIRYGSHFRWII